jgi:TolB-like protein
MPDIFLSYNREDQAVARCFAESFEQAGFSVWWDATLRSGEAYDEVTEKALREAKAVVVLWSKKSVVSRWVRAEATLADRNKTLVPVMIEACDRPIMFELTQTADLMHWQGDHSDKAWLAFVSDVRRFVLRGVDEQAAASGMLTSETSATRTAPASVITKPATPTITTVAEYQPSIAVLPFHNMSGDKEQEYFSDGLAEEIINALAQIVGLKVAARTSAFAFRGQETDIRKIAQTLGVNNILEGSVRRAGSRIRVTAQLITAKDGTHLWSERFDRELADVFAVQDEISAAIAEALKVRLSPELVTKPRYTPKLPAWEALLKARHFHWKVTVESMEQAKHYYEEAIALDARFCLAYAEYADYLYGRTTVAMSSLRDVAPTCRALALQAISVDPSMADPHNTLCTLAALHDYDWAEAHRQYQLVKAGAFVSSVAQLGIGWAYCLGAGRLALAVEHLQLAVQGDPLHLTCRAVLGRCLTAAGRYDKAEALLLQSLQLEPDFFWTHCYLGELNASRGKFAEALPYAEKTVALAPWYAQGVGLYAGVLLRLGNSEQANAVLTC